MTPREMMAKAIDQHEGGLSMRPEDNGNWFESARYKAGLPQIRNVGVLVGSKYGVTAYALANYRHDDNIAPWEMASLTRDEAIDIAEFLYIKSPRFNLLPWNAVTASVVDKGWGSGPAQAIKLLQRMVGAKDDGKLGPATVAAYERWLGQRTLEQAAIEWGDVRLKFDGMLASNDGPNDKDRIFLKGWNNRTRSFLPGTTWWKGFA